MDLETITHHLAAGGASSSDPWHYTTSVDHHLLEHATTVWVVPLLPDGRTAAVRTSSNRLHIPGGTLEPFEDWRNAAERELAEELGAAIRSIEVFGAIVSAQKVRLTAWADISEPTGPREPDLSATHVVEIRFGTPSEIIAALEEDQQAVLADIYRLALAVRAT